MSSSIRIVTNIEHSTLWSLARSFQRSLNAFKGGEQIPDCMVSNLRPFFFGELKGGV
jgi:hypothetical protein